MKNKLSKSENKFIKLSLEEKLIKCQEIEKKESLHDVSKYLLQLCVLTSIYVIQEMKKRIDIVK